MSSELLWKSIFTQYSNQNPLQNSLTESSQYRIYIILGYKMIYLFSQLFLVPIYLTYIWGYLQTFYFFYTLWVSLPFFANHILNLKNLGGWTESIQRFYVCLAYGWYSVNPWHCIRSPELCQQWSLSTELEVISDFWSYQEQNQERERESENRVKTREYLN